jgi:hypothetical protein
MHIREPSSSGKSGNWGIGRLRLDWSGIQTEVIGGLCVAAILAVARVLQPRFFSIYSIAGILLLVAAIVWHAGVRGRGDGGWHFLEGVRVFGRRLLKTLRSSHSPRIHPPAGSTLVVIASDTMREPLQLRQSIILGRVPDEGVYPVGDRYMSGRHARVYQLHGWFMIEDLDTRNGTYVNEEKLKPHLSRVLRPGDVIRMGNTVLKLQ